MRDTDLNNTGQPGIQVADIWNKLVSELSTVGSVGKLLKDNVGWAPSLIASDTLLHSSDAQVINATDTYTKKKEILIIVTGTYRVKFDLKSPDDAAYSARGTIYRDGVAYGTERTTASVTFVTYTQDLVFLAGELLQLYLKNGTTGHDAVSENLRLYGTISGDVGVDQVV